ncbi:MAG: AAA family ATPase [Bacteroidales bacterium]|nr:AAA family ATPase [Bacteroidales bacterium]
MDSNLSSAFPDTSAQNQDKVNLISTTADESVNSVTAVDTSLFNAIVDDAVHEPTEEDKAEAALLDSLMEYRMDFTNPVPEEEYLFSVDGHGFFAKGDIHGIKAKQKSGKTSAEAVLASSILSGKCFRVECLKKKLRALWLDTEQKKSDTYKIYNMVFELAHLDKTNMHDRFEMFSLRRQSMDEKMNSLRVLIADRKPDIVFIDGIVDLVKNFNEVEDSQAVIEVMMQISAEYDCAIVCVLHTNKDDTDHNMRGHLGTMLSQRAGNVFECTKRNEVITVSCSDSRHGNVPDWSIKYDAEGHLVDADVAREEAKRQQKQENAQRSKEKTLKLLNERTEKVLEILRTNGGCMKKSGLVSAVMKSIEKKETTVKNLIRELVGSKTVVTMGDTVSINGEQNLFS